MIVVSLEEILERGKDIALVPPFKVWPPRGLVVPKDEEEMDQ